MRKTDSIGQSPPLICYQAALAAAGELAMAYVIAAPCVADYSCLDVCPVDALTVLDAEGNQVVP